MWYWEVSRMLSEHMSIIRSETGTWTHCLGTKTNLAA